VVTAQSGYLSGSITAHNRDRPDDSGGFVFVGCTVVGTGQVYLGRAWGAYSRVVFLYTYMSDIIVPDGWYDWGQPSRQG
jgi:pectinesterase